MQAAATQQAVAGCTAGSGTDTITFATFAGPATIYLASGNGPLQVYTTTSVCTPTCSLTIDGPGSGSLAIDGGGQTQLFMVEQAIDFILEGVTLQNGNAPGTAGTGGAIYNQGGGDLTITNSAVSGNQAADRGLRNNDGGAIYSNAAVLTINSSSFTKNTAQDNGGAIYHYKDTAQVSGSTFSGNLSNNDNGGVIYNDQATIDITTSTFTSNGVPTVSGSGGVIYNYYGTVNLSTSTLSTNGAKWGGGIYNDGGTVSITNSTFVQNGGGSNGSAIYHDGQTLTILNSTITNPVFSASLFLDGGGASLQNTVLAASGTGQADCSGSISDLGGNLADDFSCGFTQSSSHNGTDPKLDPAGLQDNGGPTQTIALLGGSPAIHAGVATCPSTDQRGEPRPASGCDSGAYQREPGGLGVITPALPRPMTLRAQVRRQIPPLVSEAQITATVVPVSGAVVEAHIGSTVCGRAVTDSQGRYQMTVAADPPMAGCGREGAVVTFRVNGRTVAEVVAFRSGGSAALTHTLHPPSLPPGCSDCFGRR